MSVVTEYLVDQLNKGAGIFRTDFICGTCGWWVPEIFDTDDHCNHDTIYLFPPPEIVTFGRELRSRETRRK